MLGFDAGDSYHYCMSYHNEGYEDEESDDDSSSCHSDISSSSSSVHSFALETPTLKTNRSPIPHATRDPTPTPAPPTPLFPISSKGPTFHLLMHVHITCGPSAGTFRLLASSFVGFAPALDAADTEVTKSSKRSYISYHAARTLLQEAVEGFIGQEGKVVNSWAVGSRWVYDTKLIFAWMVHDLAKCMRRIVEPGQTVRARVCQDKREFDRTLSNLWVFPPLHKKDKKLVEFGKRILGAEMERITEAPYGIKEVYNSVFGYLDLMRKEMEEHERRRRGSGAYTV
ncbi:hypothetical protein IAR50_007492 [Cryptococcus sp. DSM 104548]